MSFFRRIWRTIQYWNEIDGNLLAAAVSFYASLATFPLIIVLMSTFGMITKNTGYGQGFRQHILEFVSDSSSPQMSGEIDVLLTQIEENSLLSGPLGVLFLFMLSMAVFINFEKAFGAIWKTSAEAKGVWANIRRLLLHRLRAFLMLMGVGVLILANFLSHMVIDGVAKYVGEFWQARTWWLMLHIASAVFVNTILFTLINLTLPKIKVHWTRAVQGGLFTSVTWEFGRFALAWLVISDKYNAFGVVGVFMALLMWTFYGSVVILMGGVFVRVSRKVMDEVAKEEARLAEQRQQNECEAITRN